MKEQWVFVYVYVCVCAHIYVYRGKEKVGKREVSGRERKEGKEERERGRKREKRSSKQAGYLPIYLQRSIFQASLFLYFSRIWELQKTGILRP